MPLLDPEVVAGIRDEILGLARNPVKVVPFAALTGGKALMPGRSKLVGFSVLDSVGVLTLSQTAASNVPAAGSNGVITVTGIAGKKLALTELSVSLSATIAATSTVTVTDGGVTVFSVVLPQAAGLYTIPMPANGIILGTGNTLVVTATTPGVAGVASVNIATGLSVTEASFELYNGQDTTGESLGVFVVPLGGALAPSFGGSGPDIQNGIYINVLSGTIRGSLWVVPETT